MELTEYLFAVWEITSVMTAANLTQQEQRFSDVIIKFEIWVDLFKVKNNHSKTWSADFSFS